jgi:hypothetical protein
MDEKTEELRDIFMDVTDEEAVTEQQEESRGSLTEAVASAERIGEIVAGMREKYDFDSTLSDEALATVVEGFYRGAADSTIAEELDVTRREVFRARLDLHLVRERDTDAPFDFAEFRDLLSKEVPVNDVAAHFDVSESTVRRYRRVVRAQKEARRVSDRYRSEFEDVLVDADLSEQFTSDMKDDGLEEATDGMETNVSF